MLKKFTDFTNEKKIEVNKKTTVNKSAIKSAIKTTNKEPEIKEPKTKQPKIKEIEKPKMEKFNFVGKIVKCPSNIKPSISIVMLENNNISKEKLHFIISNQTKDSLVLLKYNEKVNVKISEFVNTLINYYKKNEKIKKIFEKIVVEGNNSFSIIKNIPEIKLGDKSLIEILNDDIIKLLK